jgi:hypothetical protein
MSQSNWRFRKSGGVLAWFDENAHRARVSDIGDPVIKASQAGRHELQASQWLAGAR